MLHRSCLLAVAAAALAASLGVTSPAAAQTPTEGERLFVEGRTLMDEGKLDEACARFQKSYDLEKALGSLLNLANCEEKRGQLRTALGLWRRGAESAGEDQKNKLYALGRSADLEKRMPSVLVRVGAAGSGAKAHIDGEDIVLGERVPLDPGTHVIEVSVGAQFEQRTVTLVEGARFELDFFSGKTEPGGGGGPGPGAGGPAKPPSADDTNLAPWGWASLAVGGAAGIGFAATGFAILGECGDDVGGVSNVCTDGKPGGLLAVNFATAVLGVVGVGVGVTLLAIEAGDDDGAAQVDALVLPGGGGLRFGATF